MFLSTGSLRFAIVLLSLCLALLCGAFWRLSRMPLADPTRKIRGRLFITGIGLSTVAVASLLFLLVWWISPGVSQHLSVKTVRVLALLLFWSAVASLPLSAAGSGRIRFLGVGTSLVALFWWFSLVMHAAFSGGVVTARHTTRFLIPDGYVGWVEVDYGETGAPSLQMDDKTFVCRIPSSGVLDTSSPLEEGWAKDEYFYYSQDGTTRGLKETGWGLGGMIWGEADEWEQTQDPSKPKQAAQYFYVGTEEQYHGAVSSNESHPSNEAKSDKVAPGAAHP